MRRIDREMPEDFARYVADKCEWAVLSMASPDGIPYCVPVSIVRDREFIYFHSAKDGEKISWLKANPNVCIACVGDTHRPADKFTTEFESAIIRGTAAKVDDEEEMIHALRLICEKYTPANMGAFTDAISKSLFRTAVFKIHIDSITGKRKKYGRDGRELKFGKMEEEEK